MSRQVTDQPDNLELIGHNLNDPLRDPEVFKANQYDLIHSRFVYPGIKTARWARYIRDMKLLLRPGGWIQIMEYIPIVQSHNGRLTDQSAVRRWWQSYQAAMLRADRDPRIGRRLSQILQENRYRDVEVDVEQLHIGGWSPGAEFLVSLFLCFHPPSSLIDYWHDPFSYNDEVLSRRCRLSLRQH